MNTEREAKEALDREMAAWSYAIAHDLRAPLRIIAGFSEALEEECRDRLDEQGLDYLHRVRAAATRMQQFFDELRKLGEVAGAPLRREAVDLSAIASSIAAALRDAHPDRAVQFSIAPGLNVEGDGALLHIALGHLLGNAWKFTSRHAAAKIEVGSEKQDGQRVFYVRDDGAGFDPDYAGKLFGPLQRLHGSSEFEGAGMGLAVVRRIIHRHSGLVRAVGAIEGGATIYFALP